jgi:hypothetical protein
VLIGLAALLLLAGLRLGRAGGRMSEPGT